jgi:hypothetical protein
MKMKAKEEVRVQLGQIVATPGALEAFERNNTNGFSFIQRHSVGDWGEICPEDKEANYAALESGARLMSAYSLGDGTKIWVITEAKDDRGNRQATTLLLPEEY